MLKPTKLAPIVGNAIRPEGWLRRQLVLQAEGLGGHLDEVWPDVRDSRWIGGDREGWERVPYWLDGFIPLAWLLEDAGLKARAVRYIDAILASQAPDGWICPCPPQERAHYDMWALFLIAKVLTVYADLSGDDRVQPALTRALAQYNQYIDGATPFNWAAARWFECLIPIYWLYEKDPQPWLMDLTHKLRVEGFDYEALFDDYRDAAPQRRWTYTTHVVNLAMCLKQGALVSRMTGGDPDAFAERALDTLLRHHGMAVGHFTGDECLAGDSPVQGSELCGVVEAMYAYEVLLSVGGSPVWGDRLERLAYNALAATISPDMWTHQYDQMTNQVQCAPLPEDAVVFGTNGPQSHLFGLEPNYGCCTANFGQGWPKLALSTFLRSEDGIASAVLAPASVSVEIDGAQVRCTLDTAYPFEDTLRYTVHTDRPVEFTLSIRIPGFASGATVDGVAAAPGGFHAVRRVWRDGDTVQVSLAFEVERISRPRDMACLWRGPLLFAVPVQARWERMEYTKDGVERKHPYCDYAVYPCSDWNYGFAGTDYVVRRQPVGDMPFGEAAPPVRVEATLAPVAWALRDGVCTPEPQGRTPVGPVRRVEMIPYGCTTLRMCEMPVIDGD